MKVYLAGPEVFHLGAKAIGLNLVKECEKRGFTGLFPLDNEIALDTKENMSKAIYLANKEMIKDCDVVIANLNDWRGTEPDSGTVWECGFASALNKRVIVYMDSVAPYIDKFDYKFDTFDNGIPVVLDSKNLIIEDFDKPLNIMLSESVEVIIQGTALDALDYLKNNL